MSLAATDLQALLQAEIATLGRIAALLDEEHAALLGSDAEALESITTRKNSAIAAHQAQQEQRFSWMTAAGVARDSSLDTLLDQAGGPPACATLASELAELAGECQLRNRRNGGLIVRLQDRTRSALDILRREESSNIYSLSGAREQQTDSRTLGKA